MNRSEIRPDGSDRVFSRTTYNGRPTVAILPAPGKDGLMEAESFYLIGSHLKARSVPVPEIYRYDNISGQLLVEDLGDTKFQYVATSLMDQGHFSRLFLEYEKVLDVLVHMQVAGAEGFDPEWCWQEPYYDSNLAFDKEALYFMNAFIKDFMRLSCNQEALIQELKRLTGLVDEWCHIVFFLHRDFQSRNLMVATGAIRVIDFQAGRLGPWGYDLSSILHDPYVNIPWTMRLELYEYYLSRMTDMNEDFKRDEGLLREFFLLSMMRLLQALGAYGFLSKRKKRPFFKAFIPRALFSLDKVLESWHETDCVHLRSCVHRAIAEIS